MADSNLTPEQLIELTKMMQGNGMSEDAQSSMMMNFAKKRMSGEQSKKLEEVLGDADAVSRLMNSKQAQQILKKLSDKK